VCDQRRLHAVSHSACISCATLCASCELARVANTTHVAYFKIPCPYGLHLPIFFDSAILLSLPVLRRSSYDILV